MADVVLYDALDGVVTLTLNRPETRNAITDPVVIDALVAALSSADADATTRVVILTGAGSAFCSGGNVKTILEPGHLADPLPARTRLMYRAGVQRIPRLFEAIDVPVIAAVNGPAVGAGCDLACMCDIRIASVRARFAESFVKLGLIPGDGGAWLLQRIVGYSKAAEMTLTGDAIDAAEALACGLVSRVVPEAELMDTARTLALRIAQNPPLAVRMAKSLLREARMQSLGTVLEMSASLQALAHGTADHVEAVTASREGRSPRLSGK